MIDAPTIEIAIGRKISALASFSTSCPVDQHRVDQAEGGGDERDQDDPQHGVDQHLLEVRVGEDLVVVGQAEGQFASIFWPVCGLMTACRPVLAQPG